MMVVCAQGEFLKNALETFTWKNVNIEAKKACKLFDEHAISREAM